MGLLRVGRSAASFGVAALLVAASFVVGTADRAAAAPTTFHFEGGGYGHGVGMSQYGALGYAQQGWNYKDIIGHYFTGTTVGAANVAGEVRIQIGDDNTAPADLTMTPSATLYVVLKGQVVAQAAANQQVTATVVNGKFNVTGTTPALDQVGGGGDNLYMEYNNAPIAVADTGHTYKYGQLELNAPGATELRTTIASMGMNDYLKGLGEVPSSWPADALKAQAVAARSYAQFKLNNGATFLYGDVRDQNYVGYDKETNSGGSNWVAAVNDTGNEMGLYNGAVIQAFYSSSSGGYTENSENVFSATVPYLRGVPDPYDGANGANTLHTWKRDWSYDQMQSFVNSNAATAVGTLQSIDFPNPLGVSGRVIKVQDATHGGVVIVGSNGTKHVNGTTFQSIMNAAPGTGTNSGGALPSTLMRLGGASPYGTFSGGVYVAAGHLADSNVNRVVTGADKGGGPHVRVLTPDGDATGVEFMAYDQGFGGGVRVAVCHFGTDALDSIVTAPGPTGGPHVKTFDASGHQVGPGFMAYNPAFSGGIYVGCGDVDATNPGDEIITGAGPGGGPHVEIWDRNGNLLGSFFAYDQSFSGGVRVATSGSSIVTGPGAGMSPLVRVWNVLGVKAAEWNAYDPAFGGGVYVAGGNVMGDAAPEVITGAGDSGGPHVRVWNQQGTEQTGFMAFQTTSDHGARVAAAHVPGGAVVAGSGTGGPSLLRTITL